MNRVVEQPLPFQVNRHDPQSLVEQIVNGFVGAIRSGHYGPGERLPSIKVIAGQLDVSEMSVRNAVRRLSDQGEVIARRRTGIRVAESDKQAWRAHVLFVYMSDTYYFTARNRQFAHLMNQANVRLSSQLLGGLGNQEDLDKVRTILDCQTIDLVILDGTAAGIISEVTSRGILFVTTGAPSGSRLAQANLTDEHRPAYESMAAYCRECGVETVSVAGRIGMTPGVLEDAMAGAGMRVEFVVGDDPAPEDAASEAIERCGYAAIEQILARPRLPDLIYIADDHAARGGLTALLAAGVAVPDDVQLVIWSNHGQCPVFPKTLTRVEVNPAEHAEAYSRLVLSVLDGACKANPAPLSPTFIIGETTRKRGRG